MIKFEGGKVIEIDRKAKKVTIPPTAMRICEVACFFGSIMSLDLENTQITIIEKHAFANCYNLKEIRFPSCLEEICKGAFKNCKNLSHISLLSNRSRLRKIGSKAFEYCINLDYFVIPSHLEFIGNYSFDGCSIRIFDFRRTKVRHIGLFTFSDAKFLFPSTVSPDDIINISGENCDEIGKCHIEVDESHPVVRRDSCGYFFSNGTIFQGDKESRRVLIRRGVERIAKKCFYESKLVSVAFPSSVTEISDYAFFGCRGLKLIRFSKDSLLRVIGKGAFYECSSLRKIHFPKSLKTIKKEAFRFCSLERVAFLLDSQLERIEGAFSGTPIKHLSLPHSVREIIDVSQNMEKLESMFVSNDYYQSNEEGSAIFSKDGSELVCVIKTLKKFEIPDCVRVIKKRAFYDSSIRSLIIPPSVEIIEGKVLKDLCYLSIIEFQEGSRLKSLAFDAFVITRDLIINNEKFVKMENGVVMSLNPRGIVFVPKHLTRLEIPPGVEVIYSHAFYESRVKSLKFSKSLKKICSWAFFNSSLESVTFEEGTELDFIGNHAFYNSHIKTLKLPSIKDLDESFLNIGCKEIEFPPNLWLRKKELYLNCIEKIICPLSSLTAVAYFSIQSTGRNLFVITK